MAPSEGTTAAGRSVTTQYLKSIYLSALSPPSTRAGTVRNKCKGFSTTDGFVQPRPIRTWQDAIQKLSFAYAGPALEVRMVSQEHGFVCNASAREQESKACSRVLQPLTAVNPPILCGNVP
jgi:hypothetical protein